MKLYIFGSCSGTEPFPGRHHVSFALEVNDRFYWFDAGEGCSYTAYNMGVDLLKISHIFISHPHMDHVGGLCNLLWNIRKLWTVFHILPYAGDVKVFMPNRETWDGVMKVLQNSEGGYKSDYNTVMTEVADGVLIDGEVKVTALHNKHMKEKNGIPQTFSYKIEAEGKIIVYSGDIGSFADIEPLLTDGCDILLIETGHHSPVTICEKAKACGLIKYIYFIHHGRQILDDYDNMYTQSKAAFDGKFVFCDDKDIFTL